MKALDLNPTFRTIVKIIWACFFLFLPATSFPFFPEGLGGKTLVRPLSLYPLTLLLVLITIPRLFKRPLPKTFLPLLGFVLIALISSLVAFSNDVESLRGVSLGERFLRNIATLGIGLAFYFSVALLHQNWKDLDFSLRWLYLGFALALLWGTFQAVYILYFSPTYFEWLSKVQGFISTRKLFETRISGPTYEPKWFAEQICFVFVPWLLASILSKRSIFGFRYKWLTVEWLLLGWAAVICAFTFSRTGLFILFVLGFFSFLVFRFVLSERGEAHKTDRRKGRKSKQRAIIESALVLCGLIALIVAVGSQNTYVSRFWSYFTEARTRNRTYLEYIAVQGRFVYVETALRIFQAHPALGVGLGNYAFFFDDMVPIQKYRSPELIRQLTPIEGRDALVTPKNLIARLLAETGFIGTMTFIAFLLSILGCMVFLLLSRTSEQRFWGLGGFWAMVVFIIVTFSFDSFALPNMWVVFGLITSAAHLSDPTQSDLYPESLQEC